MLNIWYLVLSGCYEVSLIAGAFTNQNEVLSAFLTVQSIGCFVLWVRLCYLLLNQEQISEFINEMENHTTKDCFEFNQINQKINNYMKFEEKFDAMCISSVVLTIILALTKFSSDKQLPLDIYVPFDWKNSQIAYWIYYLYSVHMRWLYCFRVPFLVE